MSTYVEQPSDARLAPWIDCVWRLESSAALSENRVVPDGCIDIVYDRANGLRVVGAMTAARSCQLAANGACAGLRFHPGMASSFLGASAAELTDTSVPLEDLWSRRARQFAREMDDAESVAAAMRRLLSGLLPPSAALTPVQRAIASIAAAKGTIDTENAARQANLSQRQFRRRCQEESGLTPKLLCRILRFRYAYGLASAARRPNWPLIAQHANYFDQAHFIRDFREFTGLTPMAVFSNTRSSVTA